MRLAILTSHPIQYYAPLFRELARRAEVVVYYAHRAAPEQQAAAGFGTAFDWDVDLLGGYAHEFLHNSAQDPGVHHFAGCDTPEIGVKLADGRFGALLVTGWNLKSYWQGILAAKRRGIPLVVRGDSHLDTSRSAARRFIKSAAYPAMLRVFDAAAFVGARNRAYYERFGYPANRLFHSPHCVDAERFAAGATAEARRALRERLGLGPSDPCVLFAGRLVAFKRPLDLIDAAAIARANGMPLRVIVAGAGPLENAMRERSATADVPVHFLGFRNQSEMPAVYAAAGALALPSDGQETWGLVCNEALACGRPIVVSESAGCAPDLAADGEAGRTFPTGDAAALADAIARTLAAPPQAGSIKRVSDRHSLSAAAGGVLAAALYAAKKRRHAGTRSLSAPT